jgi:hypothetical protein
MNNRYNPILLAAFWSLLSCSPDSSQKDDSDSQDTVDTNTNTNTDSGGMGGGPCGESGICNLVVENEEVTDCLNQSTSTELSASFNESGGLDVTHVNAMEGCCPEFSADAELNLRNSTLEVGYTLVNDNCDCVCSLNLAYTITGIPPDVGFTMWAGGATLSVPSQ